jgi:hypothetical protein
MFLCSVNVVVSIYQNMNTASNLCAVYDRLLTYNLYIVNVGVVELRDIRREYAVTLAKLKIMRLCPEMEGSGK